MRYVVLTTGSCGNCYVFYENEEAIIIDDGVTYTKLSNELERHEIPMESVKGMFLTHVHPDHSKGVGAFMRKTHLPVFVSSKCKEGCEVELLKQRIKPEELNSFEFGESVSLGGFSVTSFQTSHDSVGSSGYFIQTSNSTIFLMTDTGVVPEEAYDYASKAKLKFIESNYDEEMLDNGSYPEWLKNRVRGQYGHLSNREAIDFANATSKRGDQVYFIHVSDNNNMTSIIQAMVNKEIPSGIFVKALERGEMVGGFIDE